MMETTVREYGSRGDYAKGAERMARDGWAVVSTTEQTRRSGCLRIILLGGIGALIFRPKPRILVTYSRAR